MTLQDHMIKAQNDFMVRNLSKNVTILPYLAARLTLVVEIFVFHVTLQNHVIRRSVILLLGAFRDKSPSYHVLWL